MRGEKSGTVATERGMSAVVRCCILLALILGMKSVVLNHLDNTADRLLFLAYGVLLIAVAAIWGEITQC